MIRQRGIYRKIAALAALAVFACYYAGITVFPHTHFIDGRTVTHSHPFSGKSHSHTDSGLRIIAHLSSMAAVAVAAVALAKAFSGLEIRIYLRPCSVSLSRVAEHCSLRAPPALG